MTYTRKDTIHGRPESVVRKEENEAFGRWKYGKDGKMPNPSSW